MDATVDDFLKEINEIVPPKQKTSENAWKECYDDQTGYPYYWNVNTDEVTWELPPGFKPSQEKVKQTKKANNFYIPPKTVPPVCPAILPVSTDSIKIYKIQDERSKVVDSEPVSVTTKKTDTKSKKQRRYSDSGDEKIVLISSYGSDTESEEELESNVSDTPKENIEQNKPCINDNESEEDILNKLQHQAKLLKELGGELPPEIEKLVEDEEPDRKNTVSGIALVAGYGSDLDETDEEVEENLNENNKSASLFPIASKLPENEVPRSTLFPVVEPIDVGQFLESNQDVQKPPQEENVIDVKAFQRKRKIDLDLVNAQKRLKSEDESHERRGFGFKNTVDYPGFKSGGVMFVKSDTLNADKSEKMNVDVKKNNFLLSRDFEEIRDTLSEKLTFLSEGHSPVPPVQVMLIQIETLNIALLDGSLNSNYFKQWLTDTCTDLVKLEQEAAPNGWLLQWDRLNKRYYYRNKATGESQWEYPQPDIIRCDEAMDISTTPPPPPEEDDGVPSTKSAPMVPPPPPTIRSCSPVPPPPPIISTRKKKDASKKRNVDPPLPPPESKPPLPQDTFTRGEPLPPGVDGLEVPTFTNSEENGHKQLPNDDVLSSVLDSFYSDLAAISNDSQPVTAKDDPEEKVSTVIATDQTKKKKKTKVKLTQGLAMKKKGVSKLVEKWKNVQRSLE